MSKEYLHSVFAVAHTDIRQMPFNNHGRTLRVVIEPNVDAHAVSVRFANRYGAGALPIGAASIAPCDEKGTLCPDALVPLTVNGVLSFEVEPSCEIMSDVIPFAVKAGQPFALNLYYPTGERVVSGNWIGNAYRSRPGNFSADLEMPGPNLVNRFARTVISTDMTVSTTSVREVLLHRNTPGRMLACFGDSITQQSNWTAPLEKLLHHKYPGEISLCNLGISGNRLLHGSPAHLGGLNGEAGVERFERDVLSLHGLTHAIIGIGSNDIGLPGERGLSEDELISVEQYQDGMSCLAQKLRERGGVKIYASTICPRPYVGPYNEHREALRLSMNTWLRGAPCFDAILDFDAVLRRDDGKPGMKDGYALPDGLHPSAFGGLWMAKSIDLSLFGGEADG